MRCPQAFRAKNRPALSRTVFEAIAHNQAVKSLQDYWGAERGACKRDWSYDCQDARAFWILGVECPRVCLRILASQARIEHARAAGRVSVNSSRRSRSKAYISIFLI